MIEQQFGGSYIIRRSKGSQAAAAAAAESIWHLTMLVYSSKNKNLSNKEKIIPA